VFNAWADVKLKCRLEEFLPIFPVDGAPQHLDVACDNATLAARAKSAFLSLPAEVECCIFGSKVVVLDPENGSLDTRARHVTHFRDRRTGQWHIDVDKCRWVRAIIDTLTTAGAVLEDRQDGTVLFAKRYAGCGLHFVVVAPKLRGLGSFRSGEIGGYLRTQFSHGPGHRQESFPLIWKRKK
jgi:hypothetical protein